MRILECLEMLNKFINFEEASRSSSNEKPHQIVQKIYRGMKRKSPIRNRIAQSSSILGTASVAGHRLDNVYVERWNNKDKYNSIIEWRLLFSLAQNYQKLKRDQRKADKFPLVHRPSSPHKK